MSPGPIPTTSEPEWLEALARHGLRALRTTTWSRVAVIAAHPDDECLALGGFLQALHAHGVAVHIVVATDGEAAFPDLGTTERVRLARARRRELHAAVHTHGLGRIPVTWLGLPDSGLAEHEQDLTHRLRPLLAEVDASVAPWPLDPHPDHRAAGRAAVAATPQGARVWSYPIWMWHWMRPDEAVIPWQRAALRRLSPEQRARKSAGLAEFTSQLSPGPGGQDPVLPPQVLAHFERDVEVLFEESP